MKSRRVLAFLVLVAILGVGPSAFAQKKEKEDLTKRAVQGAVTDATDNLVEGAVVQLKDTKTLQIRSFITKQDGKFHFHGLKTEIDYELKADHQGAASPSKTLSTFDSRRSAVINLKLEARK